MRKPRTAATRAARNAWLSASLVTAAALAASAPSAGQVPSLSGTWILDEAQSDDPAASVEKADHGGKIGRILRSTSGSVVIFGIPVPELPRPEERSKPRSHDDASLVNSGHVLSVIDRLTIEQDAAAIELVYDSLAAATYEHGVALETGYSTVVADWSGGRLVVEHALLSGAEITETYELDASGKRLRWNVRVKSDGIRTIRVARVYDRAQPAALQLNLTALR